MKKLAFFTIGLLLLGLGASAQISRGGKPFSFSYPLHDNLDAGKQVMPLIDVAALQSRARQVFEKGEMLPAGQIFPVSLSPENSGVWTVLPNKDRVWRLAVQVPDAPATSLYYENFYIPEGAVLYVYNAEKTHLIGSFGAHNNSESKLFATEIIYTSDCVIEYYEPANVKQKGSFTITGIANVYNAPEPPAYIKLQNPKCCGFGTSGACNVNVNCPEGAAWVNQRNSVARILIKNGASQGYCSGALINNVAQNCKNYFLTANHCGAAVSAADKNQWIFYFNYQSAGCTNGASEPGSNTITGCTMRSSASNGANSGVFGSDFLLVEFNSTIPAAYNVYYAGFDASGTGSNSGVSIHHPAGDIKKVSTYSAALTSRRYYAQLPDNSHWQANWVATVTNHGITEGGSSGSPLFNSAGRIVGKLSGGPSSCGAVAADKNDYYGKISYDWVTNGAAASQQLKPWLDPANTGTTSIAGRAACVVAGCPDIQESNNTQATAGTIAVGTNYNALIASNTDNDYYKFTVAAGTNITVSLTTLPFDYDLQLLNSAGTLLGSSANGGTSNETITFNNAAAGTYTVRVFGYNGAFSATVCYTLRVTTTAACTNTPEPNETLAAASTIAANTDVNSQIATASDLDWYKFTNTAAQSNIYVTLANLPFDYDLYLYNAAGVLLGSSTAGSTTSEAIIFNTTTVGTYHVRVIGYNGAFSTSVCYKLRAEISGTPKAAMIQPVTVTKSSNNVTLTPNPVQNKVSIEFTGTENKNEAIVITSVSGTKVWSSSVNSHAGYNKSNIILPSTLGSGLYMLQVGSRTPVKFVKQ
ncbi:MAG: pre-peptidase C-terminal domain-containing protein [Chitinophagaceae bacterium]|nr:pre-peptidase C-terminal domain-containing protein [Chitinophagaceae bacterium]